MTPFSRMIQALIAAFLLPPVPVLAQDQGAPAEGDPGVTKIFRHVMPDGRVVYSDKPLKEGKVDQTIVVDPPIKGNLWTTEAGSPPKVAPSSMPTPVSRVEAAPAPGQQKTLEDATADVIRAEMRLEDARKRQKAGVQPLPGERTGTVSGRSRLNEAYEARQKALAKEVAEAEAALEKAVQARDALR